MPINYQQLTCKYRVVGSSPARMMFTRKSYLEWYLPNIRCNRAYFPYVLLRGLFLSLIFVKWDPHLSWNHWVCGSLKNVLWTLPLGNDAYTASLNENGPFRQITYVWYIVHGVSTTRSAILNKLDSNFSRVMLSHFLSERELWNRAEDGNIIFSF